MLRAYIEVGIAPELWIAESIGATGGCKPIAIDSDEFTHDHAQYLIGRYLIRRLSLTGRDKGGKDQDERTCSDESTILRKLPELHPKVSFYLFLLASARVETCPWMTTQPSSGAATVS